MKFQTSGFKGVAIKGEAVIELNKVRGVEFEGPHEAFRYKSYVLSAPGDVITLTFSTPIEDGVEEFIDLIIDGILRATTPIRKGTGKKQPCKVSFDKVLFYRFEGEKRKGLKSGPMQVQALSSVPSIEVGVENPSTTNIGTIELQSWRKYPANAIPDELAATIVAKLDRDKRVPNCDEVARWLDKKQGLTPDVPQDFEIGFTGDSKSTKAMKDKFAEERAGFALFTSVTFHLALRESIKKLGFKGVLGYSLTLTPQSINQEPAAISSRGPSGAVLDSVVKTPSSAGASSSEESDTTEELAEPKKNPKGKTNKPVKEKSDKPAKEKINKSQKSDRLFKLNDNSEPKTGTYVEGRLDEGDPNWSGPLALKMGTSVVFPKAPKRKDKRNIIDREFPAKLIDLVGMQEKVDGPHQKFYALHKEPKKSSIHGVKGSPADKADMMGMREVSPMMGQSMITVKEYSEPSNNITDICALIPEIMVESPQIPGEASPPKPIKVSGLPVIDHTKEFTRDVDSRYIDMGELYRAPESATNSDTAEGFRSAAAIAASRAAALQDDSSQSFNTSQQEQSAMGAEQVEAAEEVAPEPETVPAILLDRENVDNVVDQLGGPAPEKLRSMTSPPPFSPVTPPADPVSLLPLTDLVDHNIPGSCSSTPRLSPNTYRSVPTAIGLGLSFGGETVIESIEIPAPIKSFELGSSPLLSEAAHMRQNQFRRQVLSESPTPSTSRGKGRSSLNNGHISKMQDSPTPLGFKPATPSLAAPVLASQSIKTAALAQATLNNSTTQVNASPAPTSLVLLPVTPTKFGLISPAVTANKRKASLISRYTAETASESESDNSKPRKITSTRDTDELDRLMKEASSRLAAAKEKRERLMADESMALKLKCLEDEADRLEEENVQREASIHSIYHAAAVKYEE